MATRWVWLGCKSYKARTHHEKYGSDFSTRSPPLIIITINSILVCLAFRGALKADISHIKFNNITRKLRLFLYKGQIRNFFFFFLVLGRERVGEILIFTLSIVGDFGGAWSPATGFDGSGTWRAGALENTE